jgi:hypothetical protein
MFLEFNMETRLPERAPPSRIDGLLGGPPLPPAHLSPPSHRCLCLRLPCNLHRQAHASIAALRQSLYRALRRHGVVEQRLIG